MPGRFAIGGRLWHLCCRYRSPCMRPPPRTRPELEPHMVKHTVSLDDKYALDESRQLLTGTQAVVRLMLTQRARDVKAGLNTAGYVTGYRGSPIASLEAAMLRARGILEPNHIKFMAGLNEDLAATALWGSQQAELRGEGKYDGVFGVWYGKGPGLDRTGDVFRHANHAGTSKHGGVLALHGRRPHLRKLDQRPPVRVRLRRLHDPGAQSGRRAGDPRLRHPRLRAVALCRRVGRHQVREGQHRGHRHGRRPHRPRADQDPRRFRHAARRVSTSASATRRSTRKRACTTTSAPPSSPSPAPTSSTASSPAAARTRRSASSPAARAISTCARRSTSWASTRSRPTSWVCASTRSA